MCEPVTGVGAGDCAEAPICSGRIRVALATLGCKVNRADGQALLQELGPAVRVVSFEDQADVYIVNSCTVTAAADRQSRQLLARARRRNASARVILTGCFPGASPGEAARLPGVDAVFSLAEHPALRAYLATLRPAPADGEGSGSPASAPDTSHGRARPCLKVQDGCDAACSYCIVPRARGPSRSTPLAEVLAALRRVAAQGHGEVVLSGIHLGAWGRDLDPPGNLAELVRGCAAVGPRLRLSSVEPQEVDSALRDLLEQEPALCPHLHLPIQSGDDQVLAAMNRPYRSDEVRELLFELRRRRPEIALGADFIAGFPGESEAQARASLDMIERSPLTHLHVFPFSPRPGTPAAGRADKLPRDLVRSRAERLRRAGRLKLLVFAASQVGSVREVLVEANDGEGRARGVTENYLRVELRGPAALRAGARVWVLIEECVGPMLRGRAVY